MSKLFAIKVKYLTDIEPITQATGGDWIDLRCAKDIELKKGDFCLIPLGVVIKLPIGCEGYLLPRSSTFKKFGIIQTNGMGIIDEAYCGDTDEWMMPVYATRDILIRKNDRIAQFRYQFKMPITTMEHHYDEVSFNDNSRGGFGSTGTK